MQVHRDEIKDRMRIQQSKQYFNATAEVLDEVHSFESIKKYRNNFAMRMVIAQVVLS